MSAYYNEIDPFAAQWLRNLIAAGHIAPGDVDERSIEDVRADELTGYEQCHFFAGIGAWSHALRAAGWPDDRPVWTGSCPCQPFSAAGKGSGTADERHLWPAWYWLIAQCRPDTLFGEQVEAAIKHGWLDLVQSDLEGIGYAVCPISLPAASVGAPHIRQRLWFMADATTVGRQYGETFAGSNGAGAYAPEQREQSGTDGRLGIVADATGSGQHRWRTGETSIGRDAPRIEPERLCDARDMGDANGMQSEQPGWQRPRTREAQSGRAFGEFAGSGATSALDHAANARRNDAGEHGSGSPLLAARPVESITAGAALRPTDGHWRDADWIACRDGKWRPVEPGTFPLAHGAANRVGRLRGYGNAICAPLATEFIRACIETLPNPD